MAIPHYTPLVGTILVCGLLDAAAFVLARLWVLPVFGDDWADVVIYVSGLGLPLLVVTMAPVVRNRRRARHRSWGRLTHLIEHAGRSVGG